MFFNSKKTKVTVYGEFSKYFEKINDLHKDIHGCPCGSCVLDTTVG